MKSNLINRIKNHTAFTPFHLFLIFGFFNGLLFLVITPPFQAPDEDKHFLRAYQITQGEIIGEKRGDEAGGFLPDYIYEMTFTFDNLPFKSKEKTSWKKAKIYFTSGSTENEKTIFCDFRNTVLYSPVPYIPQAIGIGIGRILHLPPMIIFYFGRFFALLTFLLLVGTAIRITPVYKWGMLIFALMPMTMFQATAISTDSVAFALCFLLISYVFYLAFKKEQIQRQDILIVFSLSLLLGLCKFSYIFLPLIFGIISRKKFASGKQFAFSYLIVVGGGCLGAGIWSLITRDLYLPMRPYVDPPAQMEWILSHPFEYIKVLTHTLINVTFIRDSIETFIGRLGWIDVALYVYSAYFLAIIFCGVLDTNPKVKILPYQKRIIFSVVCISAFVVITAVYCSWCEVGGQFIEGVQGRYFIPFAPLFLILLYNQKPLANKMRIIILIFFVLVALITMGNLFRRYY